tara:strand:+ start:63 stop:1160 length:1098 start_codon:yes stop_codon:yes gene_type:complete
MKTPSFFKLNTSAARRLEAAQAYSERLGQKMTKTDLVERAIQMLATSDDEVRGITTSREQPVPPLLQTYRDWKAGNRISRIQYLQLAQSAHVSYKRHAGMINSKYLIDMLQAAHAIVALRKPDNIAYDLESLDSHYRSCLYEKRATILDSFSATIERVQQVDFGAAPELPLRVLVSALRDEPPTDEFALDDAFKPYQESLFRLAIRGYWVETSKLFVDPDLAEQPSPSRYWSDCNVSKDFAHQDFRLEWGADHSSTGLRVKAGLGALPTFYEFRTFIDVTDFLCLATNLALGGSGGERGALVFAKGLDGESRSYVDFRVGQGGSRMGLRLNNEALKGLLECVSALVADEDFVARYKVLAEIYGDI